MDWTQQAKQLFNVPKSEHFTNYRHCGACAEHDAMLLAQDVNSIGIEQLGNLARVPNHAIRTAAAPMPS